ncbi:MAG: winged helix-turn-helix domain-containing protein [Candidatus Peribacteraceae bacterium]|jgi:DNA-binding transcriptional ArsR family regulator|nr:winged helix-turn-helix domain-containing protein [Candidatus Peribacteraceae bacterium]MDP7454481.1 winged helix-turn-helix domain-containing protein [Candidatus Peribacteraceae bacterium]MDP7646230.1 winged helix-turn-helix domain-containing protein [Candidatus Peribacteraceae bacterium]|tara:strand:- start:20 stop:607 length:588 start_codon:yes stop_codon:yes gene_type:complete
MSSTILKALFSSQTRVKLLSTFLLHPEEEYYIRELTRLLHEQINSIRRELENLRRIGLVRARHRNRKKYYRVDPEFSLYPELRNIFSKEIQAESPVVSSLKKLQDTELIVLAGNFVGTESKVDLLIVGEVKKEMLEALLLQDPSLKNIKYSIFSQGDFLYRLSLRDRFITTIINDPRHLIVHNLIQKQIEEAQKK